MTAPSSILACVYMTLIMGQCFSYISQMTPSQSPVARSFRAYESLQIVQRQKVSSAERLIMTLHAKQRDQIQDDGDDCGKTEDSSKGNLQPDKEQSNQKSNQTGDSTKNNDDDEEKARKRAQISKAAAELIKRSNTEEDKNESLFDRLNPFQAGQNLRKSLDSAFTSLARANRGSSVTSDARSPYYLDDRFQESGGALFDRDTNPYLSRLEKEAYVPEVLVVGATGEVGRLVVRRLLLEGRSRVRVLVRNLYSTTLNMLGTGVTYCQGDLSNMDSLEYALTDVDKIVMCAAAPRPDEKGFQEKFLGFAEDNLDSQNSPLSEIESSQYKRGATEEEVTETDMEWERLESVMEVRAQLAEQVDYIGMQNLVKAYQNVRHADYGTSQAAKRSLFKFQDRPDDFNLFVLDDGGDISTIDKLESQTSQQKSPKPTVSYATQDDSDIYYESDDKYDKYAAYYDDEFDDEYADYVEGVSDNAREGAEKRKMAAVKSQVHWIRNEFGHAVFVGKVPKPSGGGVLGCEAAVISSRLRSREGGPNEGIDLSGGFGGFVCRICADGNTYEAFIRDALYEKKGIEYVCEFCTSSKSPRKGNASRNKFVTVRLPFVSFKPIHRNSKSIDNESKIPAFHGKDVRHLGFRYRSASNANALQSKLQSGQMNSFYLALSYIKLFRTQPEPEFVYLSDARIPPMIQDGQLRHDIRQIVPVEGLSSSASGGVQLLDENALKQVTAEKMGRTAEETYFKLRGEEILKGSGLR